MFFRRHSEDFEDEVPVVVDNSFGSSTSEKSKIYFNAIDKAREILEFDKELAQKVPSCVVVGMQSVGKSAVLSRISGIRFPQDSEVCTRVAIQLRLRRARNIEDALKPIIVKAGNSEGREIDKTDDVAIENALREAQGEVLNGRKFEDKLSVKIEKEDVNLPEVTLIDLPGVFFAKDDATDDIEAQVKRMIEDRVSDPMALILHVVPLNQDTDTISTWRTVRDADHKQERTISVLTKADLALKDGKDLIKRRMCKILEDSKSSECFVVHGAAENLEDEQSKLSEVSNSIEDLGLGHQIKVGVNELNKYVEERMLEHIKEKLPEMRKMLKAELTCSENELERIGREPCSPISIAVRDSQCMRRYLAETFDLFQPDFRRLTERMSQEIYDISMAPLGRIDNDAADIISENLITPLTKSAYRVHMLALEAKTISDETRAMSNLSYAGREPELVAWLEMFAKPLDTILKEYIDDVFGAFDRMIFHSSIQRGSSDSTKGVSKDLELRIKMNVIVKAKNDAMEFVNNLIDSVKTNTFTSNDHYLSERAKELTEALNDTCLKYLKQPYRSRMETHYVTVCGVKAFLEARKTMLPDAIQLHITKSFNDLFEATEKEIGDQMLATSTINIIKESPSSIARRKFHLEREEKIRNALDEISLL